MDVGVEPNPTAALLGPCIVTEVRFAARPAGPDILSGAARSRFSDRSSLFARRVELPSLLPLKSSMRLAHRSWWPRLPGLRSRPSASSIAARGAGSTPSGADFGSLGFEPIPTGGWRSTGPRRFAFPARIVTVVALSETKGADIGYRMGARQARAGRRPCFGRLRDGDPGCPTARSPVEVPSAGDVRFSGRAPSATSNVGAGGAGACSSAFRCVSVAGRFPGSRPPELRIANISPPHPLKGSMSRWPSQ